MPSTNKKNPGCIKIKLEKTQPEKKVGFFYTPLSPEKIKMLKFYDGISTIPPPRLLLFFPFQRKNIFLLFFILAAGKTHNWKNIKRVSAQVELGWGVSVLFFAIQPTPMRREWKSQEKSIKKWGINKVLVGKKRYKAMGGHKG